MAPVSFRPYQIFFRSARPLTGTDGYPCIRASVQELADLLKLTAEKVLLRWMNYHLKKAGSARVVANFSGDIKDSEVRRWGRVQRMRLWEWFCVSLDSSLTSLGLPGPYPPPYPGVHPPPFPAPRPLRPLPDAAARPRPARGAHAAAGQQVRRGKVRSALLS